MKISQTLKGRNHSPERMAAIKAGIKPLSVEDRLMLSRKRYKGKPFIIDGVVYITPLEASLSTGIPSCDISRAIRVGAPMIRGVGIEVLT
jgi:hypothetical protein